MPTSQLAMGLLSMLKGGRDTRELNRQDEGKLLLEGFERKKGTQEDPSGFWGNLLGVVAPQRVDFADFELAPEFGPREADPKTGNVFQTSLTGGEDKFHVKGVAPPTPPNMQQVTFDDGSKGFFNPADGSFTTREGLPMEDKGRYEGVMFETQVIDGVKFVGQRNPITNKFEKIGQVEMKGERTGKDVLDLLRGIKSLEDLLDQEDMPDAQKVAIQQLIVEANAAMMEQFRTAFGTDVDIDESKRSVVGDDDEEEGAQGFGQSVINTMANMRALIDKMVGSNQSGRASVGVQPSTPPQPPAN
jgi:hypothetical protein